MYVWEQTFDSKNIKCLKMFLWVHNWKMTIFDGVIHLFFILLALYIYKKLLGIYGKASKSTLKNKQFFLFLPIPCTIFFCSFSISEAFSHIFHLGWQQFFTLFISDGDRTCGIYQDLMFMHILQLSNESKPEYWMKCLAPNAVLSCNFQYF